MSTIKPELNEKILGLSDEQVIRSRKEHGSNQLTQVKAETFSQKLYKNFSDPMIKILCVALLINVSFAAAGQAHWYEVIGIALAILLATLVSTFSEYRNENAFQKLQADASKILCKVYRNGEIVEIPQDDIVVGDCVLLQLGDKIPADGQIIQGTIKVDQSVLNGESEEVKKRILRENEIDDEKAQIDYLCPWRVFRGTVVCEGNAVFCATTVGDATSYGKIASELQIDEHRDTPLKVKLHALAQKISRFAYIGGIGIAVVLLFQKIVVQNNFDLAKISAYCSNIAAPINDLMNAVILSVVIIVMAVPEGLPLMIALVSAMNMRKMLASQILVRKIVGIETAGSLNLLFTDKTGTITKGKLEVVTFFNGASQEYPFANSKNDTLSEDLRNMLSFSIFHNTNAIMNGETIVGGNATERALLQLALHLDDGTIRNKSVDVVQNLPFNSTNKYSATEIKVAENFSLTLLKGAPEKILSRCAFFYDANGEKQPFNKEHLEKLEEQINILASRAIRVLSLATAESGFEGQSLPDGNDWNLIGIVGIRDEVRAESIQAIREVQQAGVQVVMITGDRKDTATAIAKEAGILKNPEELIFTSDELNALSDSEIKTRLQNIRVIARALPNDKSRLVRLGQEKGLVVGMTGDGVNDSPALKRADVGFAMGSGTEVAKEAGDIVILDDNFLSIDKAILYGRTIFNSVRKFITFQLMINVSAVLISFIAPLIGLGSPLSIIQILWINLVIDTLAAVAFGGEPALAKYMQDPPKRRDEDIMTPYMWSEILLGGLWIFVLSLLFFLLPSIHQLFRPDDNQVYLFTGYFTFFVFAAVFNAFNARTDEKNLFSHLSENKNFLEIIVLILAVQIFMVYYGGSILRCYGLIWNEWVVVLILAFTVIPIDLCRKIFF